MVEHTSSSGQGRERERKGPERQNPLQGHSPSDLRPLPDSTSSRFYPIPGGTIGGGAHSGSTVHAPTSQDGSHRELVATVAGNPAMESFSSRRWARGTGLNSILILVMSLHLNLVICTVGMIITSTS